MQSINKEEQAILLEALEDLMYKISMQANSYKGQPNTKERKALTKKQTQIEALQHNISIEKVK